MNRGLWAGLVLSVLAHGGAVAAVGVLGAAWLMGPRPASSPPALYVDLVHPVVATSDRPETLDTSGSRLPTERPRMGIDLTAPRAMPGAPLDGAPSPGATGLAPVPTRPPVPRAVEAPGPASAAIEAPRPPAAPPMPGLADVPAESTPSSAPATERPLPLPRMAAASPPLPSPPAPPSTDPGPRGPAVEAGTSVPRSVTPVPSTRSPSSDPEGRQQAASESSAAGSSASPGPGTAEPGDAASRGWSARGDGAGPARGGRPGAVDGANLVRLSPSEGQAGSAAGGAIPPEYEAYVRALRQRVQDRLVYPWMAVRRGQQGVVELEVHLAADGRLVAVEVVAG